MERMGAMLRKMLVCMLGMMFVAGQCFAMTFSEIERLGDVGGTPIGGIGIKGASYNNGTSYMGSKFDKQWNEKLYEKGVARFGTGDNALWMYYDCSQDRMRRYEDAYSPMFGDKDKKATVRLGTGEGESVIIHKVHNDGGLTLYLLDHSGCVAGAEIYVIMGYDKSGKFVKYIDTRDVVRNYLGEKSMGMRGVSLKKYYFSGDTFVVTYADLRKTKGRRNPVGEFRFKWDNKAQWFGVEQVVY